MKNILTLFIIFYLTLAHSQQNFVVQSNHSGYINHAKIDKKQKVLVTYGYIDNTLKFWDDKTGLLLKTEDFNNGMVSALEINETQGKLYVLSQNKISIYSTKTLNVIKEIPLERIYSIHYFEIEGSGNLTVFAQDQNYMTSLFLLDEIKDELIVASIPPVPVDVEISKHYFTNNGKYLFVIPAYQSVYVYNIETKQYTELKGDYIALFENGEVLRSIYDYEKEVLVYQRLNPSTRQIIWTRRFENAVLEEGIFQPTNSDVTFTEDRNAFWVTTLFTPLTKVDAITGEIIGAFPKAESVGALIDNGDYIYTQFNNGATFKKYKLFSEQPVFSFGNNIINPSEVVAIQNNEAAEIVFSTQFPQKIYSLFAHPQVTQFTSYETNFRDDFSNGQLVLDPSSDKVYAVTSTVDPIKVFNRGKHNSFQNLIDNYKDVQQFAFSANTKQLALLYNRGLRVINTESKAETFFKPMDIDVSFFKGSFSLAPFSNAVAYVSREIQADQLMNDKLHYFDFGSKNEKWQKQGRYFGVFHINGGKTLLVCNTTNNSIDYLDANTGNILESIPFNFENAQMDTFLSPQEDYLLFSGYKMGTVIFHLPSKKVVNQFNINNIGKFDGNFVTNTIIAVPENGAIKFIDILNAQEKARLYVFDDNSWVAYTPQGQFDGPKEGWEKVSFIKDKQLVPLQNVFNQFYTPRLLNNILVSKDFKLEGNVNNIAPPPSISLTYKEGTRNLYVDDDVTDEINATTQNGVIVINAQPNGDKIKEIRLYHNGKIVGNNTRNLFVEDDTTTNETLKEYNIELLKGLNEFSAVAINAQGTESNPYKLNVLFNPPSQGLLKPQGIQAHLLIIGIDQYENTKYNLNYAVADAGAFKEKITTGLAKITTKININFITNEEAIKENIFNTLNQIAEKANPQDIFIFYYAGHGVVDQKETQEFYLVPNNVTQLYGDEKSLLNKGISAKELRQVASGIMAQKQLYILDACQSAGALNAVATRGAVEEKAIAQLARSTGTHWLTASGSQQFATEFDELGHGVFTYVLLEALSGKADSGDQRITVNELKAYIESRVPEISEKYKGSPQYPSSFGFGQDFPLSINQ